MVMRGAKRSRKHLGNRRWGAGNIKNNRGKGDRGGVGRGGRKHRFTYAVVYERELIRRKGFSPQRSITLKEIGLHGVEKAAKEVEGKLTAELMGYKVLSNGSISRAIVVKASNFSKKAEERIKQAGGEAIKY